MKEITIISINKMLSRVKIRMKISSICKMFDCHRKKYGDFGKDKNGLCRG